MNEFGEIVNIFNLNEKEIEELITAIFDWRTPNELFDN